MQTMRLEVDGRGLATLTMDIPHPRYLPSYSSGSSIFVSEMNRSTIISS